MGSAMSSNITHQSGNLTDKPTIDRVGNREFVRARLAQSWQYDTQGKTVTHRQFLPLVFFGRSAQSARHFEKGDNIHVTGQLIRREMPRKGDAPDAAKGSSTVWEIHVTDAHRISSVTPDDEPPVHQNEMRRALSPHQAPAFIQESIHDWPL
jgi:single-stranded DNA-binding protein